MKNVVVIGACGHVGLPFSIVVANTGKYNVTGIDLNKELVMQLNCGSVPYIEEGASEGLMEAFKNNRLVFTTDDNHKALDEADIICIMIGTPVDHENNPRLDDLYNYFSGPLYDSIMRTTKNKLILLRSTVAPGTTDQITDDFFQRWVTTNTPEWHRDHGHSTPSRQISIVFCPERVAQGYGIKETKHLPQIIGARCDGDYNEAKSFFDDIVSPEAGTIRLYPKEAELAKLFTNMYRYVTFALANEYYMIGDTFSHPQGYGDWEYKHVDVHKVIKACNEKYPRMNLPLPGPNVGGPCLFKDGRFLTTHIPYADLINTSFLINEGFINFIVSKLPSSGRYDTKIGILGMTFKKDNDDTRNSLSFKMAKAVRQKGYVPMMCDPLWKGDPRNNTLEDTWEQCDVFILMTPHTEIVEFLNHPDRAKDRWPHGKIKNVVDVWNILPKGY